MLADQAALQVQRPGRRRLLRLELHLPGPVHAVVQGRAALGGDRRLRRRRHRQAVGRADGGRDHDHRLRPARRQQRRPRWRWRDSGGLEGIDKKINPGEPLFCNMYTDYKKYPNLPKLPNNVSEALNMLGNSKVLNKAFGKKNIDSYIKLKRNELDDFKKQGRFDKKRSVTKWEKDNTLDC